MPSMYRRMHRRKIEVTESHYQIAIVVLVTLLLLLGALHTHQKLRITAHEDDWALKLLAGERILGPPHQRSFVGPLVYIGNNATAERLGCNTTACSCFFRFQGSDRPSVEQDASSGSWGQSASFTSRHRASPCKPAFRTVGEYGPPWCECAMPQPAWLHQEHPEPWRRVGKALLIGPPDSPNPTHQVHIHFFWIWAWMSRLLHIQPRSLEFWVTCDPTRCLYPHEQMPSCKLDPCMGPYGRGLAKALVGEPQWLLQQREPVVFEQVKFDVRGGFPFSLFEHHHVIKAEDATALAVYADMVDQVKAFYRLQDRGLSQPLKVVISQRSEGGQLAQRVISNAPNVADALKLRGIETQIVNFGEISFEEQLKAVHDAAVLTGIHGSDLLNAIFLPSRGALVEIAPQNRGAQVVNVELPNFMFFAGKSYRRYASPINASLLHFAGGDLHGDTLMRQVGQVAVDVPSCAAAIESAAMEAAYEQTDRVGEVWHSQDPVNASFPSRFYTPKPRRHRFFG